jgi:hypothetical protein
MDFYSAEIFAYGEDSPSWNTNSKAILLGVDAKISGISAGVYYGFDGKATIAPLYGKKKDAEGKDVDDTSKVLSGQVRSIGHLEASLGYDMDGIGGGLIYQQFTAGDIKKATRSAGGKLKTSETVAKGTDTFTLLGVGMNGDSTLFGVKDLVQTGDKISYALSWSMMSWKNSEAKGKEKDSYTDKDTNQLVAAVGYKVGGMTTELNFEQKMTKGKVLLNSKGEENKSKSASKMYVTSIYEF